MQSGLRSVDLPLWRKRKFVRLRPNRPSLPDDAEEVARRRRHRDRGATPGCIAPHAGYSNFASKSASPAVTRATETKPSEPSGPSVVETMSALTAARERPDRRRNELFLLPYADQTAIPAAPQIMNFNPPVLAEIQTGADR